MRKILQILVFIFLSCSLLAQEHPYVNVTFFGSSVCRGSGAEDRKGYAWQFFHSGAIDTSRFRYYNASTGGDNTIKVEQEDRMQTKLFPTNPDIVVIGLSLANEGIMRPDNENGREQIVEQFRSRLLALADSLNSLGIKPVIVNCYAQSRFNKSHYDFTKKMNRIINTWKYPSVNVLGTIDDLTGKWVEGYLADPGHPNTAGHKEMSYAIVPSLFDAILSGKKTPVYDWHKSYSAIFNKDQIEHPLAIDIKNTMHSFTLSFRLKETVEGSIAGFTANGRNHTISISGQAIHYKELSGPYPENPVGWIHVLLSHSYANQKTTLFINGEPIGSMKEQLSPTRVYFGGTAKSTELKDLTLHRSALNESEAGDLYNKKFIQSSLEFYNPLTRPVSGNELYNYGQSLTECNIDKRIEMQFNKIEFY